jgi:putative methyltransferase (TIGR04325 family)
MSRLRSWITALTPPIVPLGLRTLFPKRKPAPSEPIAEEQPEFEHVAEGWSRPVQGWNTDSVLALYEEKWPTFRRALEGAGPLGVNHEAPREAIERADDVAYAHNLLVSFAYVLALAAGGRDRVSILDWGGGIGHYYVVARAVLPGVAVDYTSRDLPVLAARGRKLLPDAAFSDDDTCLERRYDLVLASSSLHYAEDWRGTLAGLAGATAGYLYLTRVPLALQSPSFVVLQRAQRHGYGTEYLGWVLNRDELLETAHGLGLRLVREFLVYAQFAAEGAPEKPTRHGGFLFRPNTEET